MKNRPPIPKRSGIYRILNKNNGKVYIGSAANLQKRRNAHLRNLRNGDHINSHLQYAWLKYGADSFAFQIVEFVDDVNDLIKREQFWIDTLNCTVRAYGYNISPIAGSQLGMKHTEETKARISAAGFNMSAEVKAKISAAGRGRPWTAAKREKSTGWKHTDESKAKMSASLKKYNATHKRSPETIARVCAARRNRPPFTEETKAKMSESAKHRPPVSLETRAKRSESRLRLYAKRNGVSYEEYIMLPLRDHHAHPNKPLHGGMTDE